MNQGDVFGIDLGDPVASGPGYKHPCVVIQNDVFNQSRINTIIVCLITSNLAHAKAPGNVLIKKEEASLPKDSVANISQIITVDRSLLDEKIGSLSRSMIREIIEGLRLLLEPRGPLDR
ncbi:MAG: type II toxin-antitoxin system PemK/MazF family toxin [Syntrophus sp. (in: bacteria)]|nr:type II toxin-antitoxin system PemK/MazF family toxin [Syntrophus sp. (in: bacteria)]